MKMLCSSLLLVVLATAPFEATYANASAATATLSTADHDAFGGGYKFKRKKRKKSHGGMHRRHKGGFLGFGR